MTNPIQDFDVVLDQMTVVVMTVVVRYADLTPGTMIVDLMYQKRLTDTIQFELSFVVEVLPVKGCFRREFVNVTILSHNSGLIKLYVRGESEVTIFRHNDYDIFY